ncbi:MAG: tetratricopeptide repeat protein, partial [Bacteroidetes bacterium]|nr:tetratricopeptide repeat protein [Bacteroidota bacterium]
MSNPKSLISIIFLFAFLLFIKISLAQDLHKADSLIGKLKTVSHDTDKIKLLFKIGSIYENSFSDTALYFYNVAFSEAVKVKNAKYTANSLKHIANVYLDKCIYNKALEYYFKSLNISIRLNDKSEEALCYNSIGIVYNEMGSFSKSIEYCMKSLKIMEEIN